MEPLEEIADFVDKRGPTFTALADAAWDYRVLRWQEFEPVERQIALARDLGFRVGSNVGGVTSAFTAQAGQGGPVLAFLGEHDALAGLSQTPGSATRGPEPAGESGCGREGGRHLRDPASLLAAATAEYLKTRQLPGRARYYGCPAEEAAAGLSFLVEEGAFSDVNVALSWQPGLFTATRQACTLACAQAYFSYQGTSLQAGGSPERGRSALDAVELLNGGTNFLREYMSGDSRVRYVSADAGTLPPNVVPMQASACYIVRATTVADMLELYDLVQTIAVGAALMTDTQLTVEVAGASAEFLPNETLEGVLHRNLNQLGGVPFDEDDQDTAADFAATFGPSEAARDRAEAGVAAGHAAALHDDVPPPPAVLPRRRVALWTGVGDVSWVNPTVQLSVAVAALGTPPHSWQLIAQGKLPAAHKGMLHAAKVIAGTAIDLVRDPVVLELATSEFREATATRPYRSPIPEGVVPPPART